MSFSASLRSPQTGALVPDGSYQVRFSVYSMAADGSPLWSETQDVKVQGGVVQADLGAVTPLSESLAFSQGTYWLGIAVGSDAEMVPRYRIGAVPLALDSSTLDGASAGTGAGSVLLLDSF